MNRFHGRGIESHRKEYADKKAALGHCQLLSLQRGDGKYGGCQVVDVEEYLKKV